MRKLQCAVPNSVSHFIVILIYTNCFHVCAHAFDEYGSESFTGVRPLVVPQDAAPPLCPLAYPGSGTRRVTRTIWMKRVKNNVSDTGSPEQRGSGAGFAIASETSPVLDKLFRSGGVN